MEYKTKCLIIGSGAGGCTAGIYTARAGLEPVLVCGSDLGGQLATTSDVENYSGFISIKGSELMDKFREQAEHCGANIVFDIITDIDFSKRPFVCKGDMNTFIADTIIIATGAKAKWLGLPSEQKYKGFGISACAVCDGAFFKDKTVAVVGGGNSAITEALYLSTIAKKVYLIHRSENFKAEKVLLDKVKKDDKIELVVNSIVEEILGEENGISKKVNGALVKNINTNDVKNISLDGVFVAIGHQPCNELFKGKLQLTEHGYVSVDPLTLETSIKGVFACGDIRNEMHKQAIIAAGDGCICALEVEKFLREQQ